MLHKLLYKFTANKPCRLINLESGPYLERYYLGKFLGITFLLHRFVSSDSEKHLHNHPWNHGGSLILTGGYTEEQVIDICPTVPGSGCITRMVERRWFNRVDGNTFHRVHSAKPNTWTLFMHGKRAMMQWPDDLGFLKPMLKSWGFLERAYVPGYHETTIFRPQPATPEQWWLDKPTGDKAGRMPL